MNSKLYQPIIISFLVHLCLVLLLLLMPATPPLLEHPQDVEIVYQNETKKEQQQIVTDVTPLKTAVDKLKEKVKRLSAVTRRVLEEQVARNKGETKNGADSPTFERQMLQNQSQNPSELKNKGEQKSEENPFEKSPDGERPSITAPMGGGGPHPRLPDSSISDFIPEVKEGGFTALNQDQFVYYTFYARINEQVRNRWVDNIRAIISRTSQATLNKLSEQPQITQIEVILTADGKFVRAVLYRKAEIHDLDDAAAGAFRLAAPFNNPPSEIVEKDGLIHLFYLFHLELRPGFIARDGSR